ncbi:MAG: hypothetical protein VZT48_10420 [Bulleidia sp.]|nr:hypothetical protein [Bulleidia sp.]
MKKIGPIASRIAMTYVSDLLYSLLFAKEYDQNIETVGTHIDVIKKTQK